MIYQPMWKRNMKSRLAIKFPPPMSGDQIPHPGKNKMIKFPPPGQEKESNALGMPRGGGGGENVEASI